MAERAATRAWLERQPDAPEPLHSRLLALFDEDDAAAPSPTVRADTGVVDALIDAAAEALEAAVAGTGEGEARSSDGLRPGAAELLLADALVTYAVAAAAEAGVPMSNVLERVQHRALAPMSGHS